MKNLNSEDGRGEKGNKEGIRGDGFQRRRRSHKLVPGPHGGGHSGHQGAAKGGGPRRRSPRRPHSLVLR